MICQRCQHRPRPTGRTLCRLCLAEVTVAAQARVTHELQAGQTVPDHTLGRLA